nr:uncharacterized mitochondrial protein AtMg00810-like [Tanacetum cinerariifolium]
TKKTKKYQLKQQYGNFKAEGSETLEQTFNRLQAIRNRGDLDTMSLDDVYNHLKVYEPKVQKKLKLNFQNMAFISLANTSSGKGEVHTASTQVSTASADVAATSISHDTVCAYIASQSNGSQIKYKDITQIDEDDIKEMDIKWNMALLSMRADRFWKKTSKKITIQGTNVAGFDKSKVECFNCHKMGHFARECRAARSQDRGRRESYKQENHALVADDEALTEFALMAKSSSSLENEVKKEKEGLDSKLTGFESASKDLDTLLGSQKTDKNKKGLGYSVVPPLLLKPSPSIESNASDFQNSNPSASKHGESSNSIMSKLMIKFMKAANSPTIIKTNKVKTARKPSVKYAEMYRNTSKSPKVRGNKGKAVKASACWIWRPKQNIIEKGGGKITGKGIIKTGKLEFENVYFMKDLKYNLFSVSQICDNKNSVLFTDSECIVLGKDFKLKDDTNVLLRTPRQHNTLGHLNFKTMNKLVRHNLVKGLPSKCFENDHTCVACLKGKQHKASYHLGKFDAKGDAGYFVGYSMSSKAFRVFNKRTKKVEENLHVDLLENKLIEKGAGPNWLFDIDTLTNSMNYVPVVVAGTSSTNISGIKDIASHGVKKDVSSLRYIALTNWFHEAHLESSNSDAQDACNAAVFENSGISNPTATSKIPTADQMESLTVESVIPTVSSPVLNACLETSPETTSGSRLISKEVIRQEETSSLDNILTLSNRFEDILGDTTNIVDTNGVEADFSNMESSIPASPTPTFKIHKDHPKSQIIGPVDTPVQTRHKSKEMEEHSFIATIHQKTTPDFLQGTIDQTLFIRKHRGDFLLVQVYVDDIIFGSSNPQLCRKFEALMHEKFQMSAMGELNFFLGLQALQKKDGIFLSQDKYVGDILKKFGYSDVRSANTPMDKENPWGKDRPGKDVEPYLYRSMIGSLMYLTASRPDIMFAICAYARYQVTPKECHLHAVKRIFRYLKGHPKLGLWYPKESTFDLVAYSDSDYGGATQDRKSTTRGCQFLGRRLIS